MNKHTPGPWNCYIPEIGNEKDTNDVGNFYWSIHPDLFHSDVNYLHVTGWMSEANARLIAAAPDLLEVVKSLLECGDFFTSAIEAKNHSVDFEELEVFARAVVSKATGEV